MYGEEQYPAQSFQDMIIYKKTLNIASFCCVNLFLTPFIAVSIGIPVGLIPFLITQALSEHQNGLFAPVVFLIVFEICWCFGIRNFYFAVAKGFGPDYDEMSSMGQIRQHIQTYEANNEGGFQNQMVDVNVLASRITGKFYPTVV